MYDKNAIPPICRNHLIFFFLCFPSLSTFGAALIAPRIPSNSGASEHGRTLGSPRTCGRALRFCLLPNAESNNLSISSPAFLLRLDECLGDVTVECCSESFLGVETGIGLAWEGVGASFFDDCWTLQASGSLFNSSRFIFRTKYFPYCDPAKVCS